MSTDTEERPTEAKLIIKVSSITYRAYSMGMLQESIPSSCYTVLNATVQETAYLPLDMFPFFALHGRQPHKPEIGHPLLKAMFHVQLLTR